MMYSDDFQNSVAKKNASVSLPKMSKFLLLSTGGTECFFSFIFFGSLEIENNFWHQVTVWMML